MNVDKININQTEQTYYISSDIYDVSARNNDAVFESLSALLSSSNLDTLIPTAVRCGGMSIKFIQSSDNRYVQYRLMSDTFSTTESDWQGVDDEPTAGSDNLVKSGGVFSSINAETARADAAEQANETLINNIFNTQTISLNIPDTFSGYLFSSPLFFRKKLDLINIKYNKETTVSRNDITILMFLEDGATKLLVIDSKLIDKSAGYFLYIGKYVEKILIRVSEGTKSGILSLDISLGVCATTDYVDFINNGFLYDFSYTASNSGIYKSFGDYKPDNINGYKTDILDIYITSEVDFGLMAQYNNSYHSLHSGHNLINVVKGDSSVVNIYTNSHIEEKTVTGIYVEGIYSIDSFVSNLSNNTNNCIKEIETLKNGSEIHEADAKVKNGNQIFWINNKVKNCKRVIVKILEKTYEGGVNLSVVDNGVECYIPISNGIIKYHNEDSDITVI